MNYLKAINSLRRGSSYTAMTSKYEDIIWQDEKSPIPTKKECEEELKRLEEEEKKTQYRKDRAKAYAPISDQLDYIFHHGLAKWKTDIVQPVKDKFPKP